MSKYKIYLQKKTQKKRLLIYGAGVAGRLVLEEIERYKGKDYEVVAFIDDDKGKLSKTIDGVRVLGGLNSLKTIKKRGLEIDEVLISIPTASARVIKKIVDSCEDVGLSYKILPGIYDIITGKIKVSPVRDVQIEDVLGRESVKVSFDKISKFLDGKVLAVFGAGGSIGAEKSRQIAEFKPRRLILFDQNESELYDLHMELIASEKAENVVPIVGDIRDYQDVEWVFEKYRPDIVFHAAAYKHVPLMENHPKQAVNTNVGGTLNLLKANEKFSSKNFVFISTDKAVYPANVMGLTKRVGELLLTNRAKGYTKTKFSTVRFGNVLHSRGSVVPLFLKQIAMGGPVTVTHRKVERFFMTIPEAAQLVLQAAATAKGGEIFMLEMGEKVKILDLAKQVIRLAGFEPEKDIKIKFVGLRSGEKLTEALKTKDERKIPTNHEKISKIITKERPDIREFAEDLLKLSKTGNEKQIIKKLKEIK